ncbi:putative ATP-dependent helicase C29A10.10c [Artemisia annua]|uniref:Putative ATP-dependent helicase C29A10.10c n=1 Tax=Artemisia annua TaxID=35608 RepID=A0A2U1N0X1_ARTAN|nr:putative ATP-dependent helicase C29A10.10c [Artemisia annua]
MVNMSVASFKQLTSKLMKIQAQRDMNRFQFLISLEAFDVLVVDEAAQVNEAGVLLALSVEATRYVLVWDPKQLPATLMCQKAKQLGYDRSLFERLKLGDSEAIRKLGDKPYYKCLKPYPLYNVVNGQKQHASGSMSPYNEVECLAGFEIYDNLKEKIS